VRTRAYGDGLIDWDIATGKPTRRFGELKQTEGPWAELASSADGRRRAGLQYPPPGQAGENRLQVRDLEADQPRDLGAVPRSMRGALSPDGSLFAGLVSDGAKRVLRCWDIEARKLLFEREVGGETDAFWQPSVLADGRILLTGSVHGSVIGFDSRTGRELLRWKMGDAPSQRASELALQILLFPGGRYLACLTPATRAAEHGPGVEIRELETGRIIRRLAGEARMYGMGFSPDGNRFAAGTTGEEPHVFVWDVTTGQKLNEFAGHRGRILNAAFSPDGKRLATGSVDCTGLVWNVEP
jgi:WD40 repeat protein